MADDTKYNESWAAATAGPIRGLVTFYVNGTTVFANVAPTPQPVAEAESVDWAHRIAEALRERPPEPAKVAHPVCPDCKTPLKKVRQSADSPLNEHQFDAVKAGDYYCEKCPSNDRGNQPYRYFWQSELTGGRDVPAST